MLMILKIFLLIVFPPAGVFINCGITSQFWINILLTLLGYLPGLIHGIWVLSSNKCNLN